MGHVIGIALGGADGVWQELDEAKALLPDGCEPIVSACNNAGFDYPGRLDHWCSHHIELFPRWLAKRAANGFTAAGQLWAHENRYPNDPLVVARLPNWAGSSGLLTVQVLLHVGCTRVIVCGIPQTPAAHYDDARSWRDFGNYRRGWMARKTMLAGVRSMSGWTRELLGAPTKEWLNGQSGHESGEARRQGTA